ncbi:NADH-quinone oxidoreductase subunit C [bacterium]|nr:NADH-quinone oxidoreductase subunit C [bacterium]
MKDPLKDKLTSAFDGIQIQPADRNQISITANKESILSVLSLLKSNGYNHLALISCVDWIEEKRFELVYILSAYMEKDKHFTDMEKTNIILKTSIYREKPQFISAIPIFENAEPYEREIHELYGIHFEGHPRLTPLFLEREYKTPPFRKDFDTRKYVSDVFDPIPFVGKKADKR